VSAGAGDLEAGELVAIDEDISQAVLQNEVQEGITGGGVRPSIPIAVGYTKTVLFGRLFETPVMIGVAAGTVLYTKGVIIVVNHLV
jgi:hypothetical protein